MALDAFWWSGSLWVPSGRCRAALPILAASIAAAACSSVGVPKPGMKRTARCANRSGGVSFPTRTSRGRAGAPAFNALLCTVEVLLPFIDLGYSRWVAVGLPRP